jgi:hypothetical protein
MVGETATAPSPDNSVVMSQLSDVPCYDINELALLVKPHHQVVRICSLQSVKNVSVNSSAAVPEQHLFNSLALLV